MNLGIRGKIFGGMLLVALMGLGVGVVGIVNLAQVAQADADMYRFNTLPLGSGGTIAVLVQRIRANLDGPIVENDPKTIDHYVSRVKEFLGAIDAEDAGIHSGVSDGTDEQNWQNFQTAKAAFVKETGAVSALYLAGKTDLARTELLGPWRKTYDPLVAVLDTTNKKTIDDSKQGTLGNAALATGASTLMVTVISLAMAISLGFAWF